MSELSNAPASANGAEVEHDVDALVIGAGFAGLYMVHKLREMGFSVHGLEKGTGVGGTWYWNRYPGARCDSESMYYQFSFMDEFEQEWPLEERYPGQPKILNYLNTVADRLHLKQEFSFNTKVERLSFDDDTSRWTVRTDDGGTWTAQFVVTAVGCLSEANKPEFPGDDTFAGEVYHTGHWPHEPVDFTGKRVGIIGTGASAIQAIPVIAQQAEHLTVFQRTAQFTLPAANGPLNQQMAELWKANYKEWWRRAKHSRAGIPYPASAASALDHTPEQRRETYEGGWEQGGFQFVGGTYADLMTNEEANATAAEFVKGKIDEIVEDPEVARKLKPSGFPFGTKRLPLDSGYYDTFNRPNVTLVSLKEEPLEAITPQGVKAGGNVHELDVLVYATGFDAVDGPLKALNIEGRGGQKLEEVWAEGPRTYLGLSVPGFPNLLTITGPGSPSVLSNMPVSIEQHVEWIAETLGNLRERGIDVIEATPEATETWTAHVQEVAHTTLYPKAGSWYMGANIPGKPRMFLPYIGGLGAYREKCNEVTANGYEGFELQAGAMAEAGA